MMRPIELKEICVKVDFQLPREECKRKTREDCRLDENMSFVCLSIFLCVYMSLFFCMSAFSLVCLSFLVRRLHENQSVCRIPNCLFVCLNGRLFVFLPIYLFVCLSISLFVCLSVCFVLGFVWYSINSTHKILSLCLSICKLKDLCLTLVYVRPIK